MMRAGCKNILKHVRDHRHREAIFPLPFPDRLARSSMAPVRVPSVCSAIPIAIKFLPQFKA